MRIYLLWWDDDSWGNDVILARSWVEAARLAIEAARRNFCEGYADKPRDMIASIEDLGEAHEPRFVVLPD